MSSDPTMDHADITRQPHLFGDIDDGDPESLYGDAESLYGDFEDGDPDPLATYAEISGDIDDPEEGDLRSMMQRAGAFIKRNKKPLLIGGGLLAGGTAAALIARQIRKKRAEAAVRQSLQRERYNQSIRNAALVQKSVGPLHRNALMRFFSLKGAKMNSSPIAPLETFVVDMLKNLLDRQATDTPFLQETAIGVFAAGTWTATATGIVPNRFYTALILQIGTNQLNAAPGTVINVTGTFPTLQGNLVIAANPWLFTYEMGYDVRFLFYPWLLVTNKPMPLLGQYSNANNITAVVTGIPAASAVNLVVPGSIHPWTVAMRNALMKR